MFVVPKQISAALNGGGGLYHLFFYVGVRLVFSGAVVPIDRRSEMVGVCAWINQMAVPFITAEILTSCKRA
jgi:hypothetical protein